MDFSGKSVFVTGASNGLGREIAISFARCGAGTIILTGRNEERLLKVTEECKKHCQNIFSIVGCMENKDDVERIAAFVEEKMQGKLDIFVGNHGNAGSKLTTVPDFDMDTFNKIMEINFISNVRLTNTLCRIIPKGGSIVFTTSLNSTLTSKNRAALCSSKAALMMFMKCAAIDLGSRGIRVNAVAPGVMDTDFYRCSYESKEQQKDDLEKIRKQLPTKHIPTVQGVANAVLFLASDLAVDITGIEQTVDCGQSLLLGNAQ